MKKNNFDDDVSFVSRHFVEGLSRPLLKFSDNRFRLTRWAAAAVGLVAIGASAYFIAGRSDAPRGPESPDTVAAVAPAPTVADPQRVERIVFDNAPIDSVAAEVSRVYGVTLINLPQGDIRLTLSYEGTAGDFVETANELLGSHITIKEQQ